jgi:hypothetical protein
MPLETNQTLWLARFAGVGIGDLDLDAQLLIARAAEEIEAATAKKVHLDQMRRDVSALKGRIRAAFHDDIALKSGESMKMIDADQTQAFDWWEDIGKVDMDNLMTSQRDQRMSEAKGELTLIEQRMADLRFFWSQKNDDETELERGDSQPLFDTPTLIQELYTPLVREQILPETFVEDEFSQVQQMIDATNDVYIQELESVSDNTERDENLALFKSTIATMASIATDAIDINLNAETMGKTATDAQKTQVAFEKSCVVLIAATITTTVDVGVKLSDGKPRDAINGALASMAKSAGFVVTQATGSKEIGKYVTIAMTATSHTDKLVKAVQDSDSNAIISSVIDMVGDGFDFRSVEADPELGKKLAATKVAVDAALRGALAAKKADLITAIQNREWAKVRTVLVGATTESARAVFADQFKDKIAKTDKNLEKIAQSLTTLSQTLADNEQVKAVEEAEQAQEELQKESAQELLKAEQEAFENSLELLGQRENLEKGELKQISKLIADLKRDAAILKAATTVGGAGFAVAKEFLAPLAIGGTLIAFATTLAAAIDRAISMRKWIESQEEALKSANPYLTSIQNFVKSQREQFTHKSISAALLLLRAAAQITATAGTGTPIQAIATIVDKGLSMAASLEDLTFKFHQAKELKKAWKITKRALDNPENRKANLMARRQNPTLAKYSIAYGAVVAKDVVAVSAMNRIGLSRETLAQKDANIQNVKTYLEELYADDIKVKRKYVHQKGWAADLPSPEISPRSWMLSVQVALEKGGMDGSQDADLNRLFTQAAEQLVILDVEKGKVEPDKPVVTEVGRTLGDLQKALTAFAPVRKSESGGGPLRELSSHRNLYLTTLTDHLGEVMVLLAA